MRSADGRFAYLDADERPVPDGTEPAGVHRVAFRCRTHNTWCSVNLRGRGHDKPNKSWSWDGDVDHPTLQPSINCLDCWHGFIEKGVFLTANKSREAKQ